MGIPVLHTQAEAMAMGPWNVTEDGVAWILITVMDIGEIGSHSWETSSLPCMEVEQKFDLGSNIWGQLPWAVWPWESQLLNCTPDSVLPRVENHFFSGKDLRKTMLQMKICTARNTRDLLSVTQTVWVYRALPGRKRGHELPKIPSYEDWTCHECILLIYTIPFNLYSLRKV